MIGHTIDDAAMQLAANIAKLKNISVDDALRFLGGKSFANNAQAQMMARGAQSSAIGRFASGKLANKALRVVPALGIGLTALDAADIVTNDTNIGNKVMDTAAMGIGGAIGGVLGAGNPLAISTGASLGKAASDATQFIIGGGETPEERKLKEALALLQGGRV